MNELEEWVDKPYKEARRLFDEHYLRIQVEKTKGDVSAAALRAGIHRYRNWISSWWSNVWWSNIG